MSAAPAAPAPAPAAVADPYANEGPPAVPESNVASPSQQAPASAPAGSDANFPTGLVERLPSSAYPEPVIRGLYGGPLWLDMQGLQFPYYPRIGVGVSGYGWVDTNYKYTRIGDPTQSSHVTQLFAQGRYALRLTPTYTNGSWFVQAQAELIANVNQLATKPAVVDTDDLWIRTGVWKSWDITVGRFEAFPVYQLGMGLDLNTDERIGAYDQLNSPPQPYLASFIYYRPAEPALEYIAYHLYLRDSPRAVLRPIRFEALAAWGTTTDLTIAATGMPVQLNNLGGRPALIYDLGWLKLRAAAEYLWQFSPDPAPTMHYEQRKRGAAGSVQFVFAPLVEFGANVGRAVVDRYTPDTMQTDGSYAPDPAQSGDIWSYGGFIDFRPLEDTLIGAGANYASFSNLHTNAAMDRDNRSTNKQFYVAFQQLVRHQLFVKVVAGYAKSHFDLAYRGASSYDDDAFSVRVRLMYLY